MATYKTPTGETIEAEKYYSATTYLGLYLVRTEDGHIFDVEGGEAVEVNDRTLPEIEAAVIAWLDDPNIQSADDFSGKTLSDWEYIRTIV